MSCVAVVVGNFPGAGVCLLVGELAEMPLPTPPRGLSVLYRPSDPETRTEGSGGGRWRLSTGVLTGGRFQPRAVLSSNALLE